MTPTQLGWHRGYWEKQVKNYTHWLKSSQEDVLKYERLVQDATEALQAIEALIAVDKK